MVESDTIRIALVVYEILNRIAHSCVYLSASAFHYQIADPDIGGIYMTLLNSGMQFLSPNQYSQSTRYRGRSPAEH